MFEKFGSENLRPMLSGALILLLLVGCAAGANGIAFQRQAIPAGQSLIYVYKAPNQFPAAQGLPILLDGKDIGLLRNDGYLAIAATPGSHVLSVGLLDDFGSKFSAVSNPLSLDVQAGDDQFVSVRASRGAPTGFHYVGDVTYSNSFVVFEGITKSVALTEIKSLRLSQQ